MTAAVTRSKPPLVLISMINPVMRRLLVSRFHAGPDKALLLLHLRGRKSGRGYDIPVGYHELPDGALRVLTNSPWRVNLRGGADVEVTHRGARRPMRAQMDEHAESVALVYSEMVERLGWQAAQRRLGIKIHVGRTPTTDELEEFVRESGISVIRLTALTAG